MGGKGMDDKQALTIQCELHGAPMDDEVRALRTAIVELVGKRATAGDVNGPRNGRFEITADLEAQAVEALRLELHRLARRHGAEITRFSVVPAGGDRG